MNLRFKTLPGGRKQVIYGQFSFTTAPSRPLKCWIVTAGRIGEEKREQVATAPTGQDAYNLALRHMIGLLATALQIARTYSGHRQRSQIIAHQRRLCLELHGV